MMTDRKDGFDERRQPMTPTRHRRRHAGAAFVAALCAAVAFATATALARDGIAAGSLPDAVAASAARSAPISRETAADFPVWKRITIGTGNGVDVVRDRLDAARIFVGDTADEILGRPAFVFGRTRMQLDLVVVTPAELGFLERVTLADIYHRAMQRGLELCPAETAPLLRLAYADQPVGEFLHVAMHPVATWSGNLVDLTVANGGAGLVLLGGDASPGLELSPATKFVFVHPARIAMPNAPPAP